MPKEYQYLIVITMVFALLMLILGGLRMPWNEHAVPYALYGAAVGFYLAVVIGMVVVWNMVDQEKKKK